MRGLDCNLTLMYSMYTLAHDELCLNYIVLATSKTEPFKIENSKVQRTKDLYNHHDIYHNVNCVE